MRILLTEDNIALADGLSAILRGTGHAVDVV
ncbi:DNA-binding response regulator, partial [Rhizobium ruizarguesonis]